jgi:hypothetical protein
LFLNLDELLDSLLELSSPYGVKAQTHASIIASTPGGINRQLLPGAHGWLRPLAHRGWSGL